MLSFSVLLLSCFRQALKKESIMASSLTVGEASISGGSSSFGMIAYYFSSVSPCKQDGVAVEIVGSPELFHNLEKFNIW